MQLLVQHPTGNRNVRAVLEALQDADLLAEFATTIAVNPAAAWLKLLPAASRQEWLRRAFPVPAAQVWTHPWQELARMVLPRLGLGGGVGAADIDTVYQGLDDAVAQRLPQLARLKPLGAVYAYEDGALATFAQAKKLGLSCVYDLPIAYWETGRRLMQEEAERLPAWAPTLGGGITDSAAKLARKTQELELADVVVGPSEFVMDSLPPWARGKRLVLAPFGSPAAPARQNAEPDEARANCRPLRVLFVGSMGQRKGLGDLFAAMRLLHRADIELVVMGSLLAPMKFYQSQLPAFTYEPSRPHAQVLALMRSCDVFCLPSIVEGRALVMQEAMSQGLPLLITSNTGGADLIEEGKTGFLVPISSPVALADKLTWFAENRNQLPAMGRAAQAHAARYTWENYGARIIQALTSTTSVRPPAHAC